MIKTIKQADDWSCAACVAAMITGETLQDVIDFVGHDGSRQDEAEKHPDKRVGFKTYEVDQYLMSRGYSYSQAFQLSDPDQVGNDSVMGEISLSGPLYFVVKSARLEGCTHAIYWDGENIHDPSPNAPENPKLSDYEIKEFMMIYKYRPEEVAEWRRNHNA